MRRDTQWNDVVEKNNAYYQAVWTLFMDLSDDGKLVLIDELLNRASPPATELLASCRREIIEKMQPQ